MATASSPRWQHGPIFRFFASLKLAVVLLAALIVASIAGTVYESSFDARVARAYVYGASWFNLWLILLATNLAVSALSRWPWRQHHVAFLVTHLGIITLLTGALIGRIFGIEGTITLFKGEPATNRLLLNEHQLRVYDSDGIIKGYSAEFLHHPPTAEHPRELGTLASGAHLSVVGYAPAINTTLNPRVLDSGGVPAVHVTLSTAMMGQKVDSWLLADDPQHGLFEMGLAKIEFKSGRATPQSSAITSGTTELEESIFAFANAPEQQIGHVAKGGPTGAKISLSPPANGSKGEVTISVAGRTQTIDVAASLQREIPLDGTNLMARIENYWPDFRIENGKPVTASINPNNPAILITLRGRAPPSESPNVSHGGGKVVPTNGGPSTLPSLAPEMSQANAAANHLTLFVADDGTISYQLRSRRNGDSAGALKPNQLLTTGWADWQLLIDRTLPHAEAFMDFTPANSTNDNSPDGLRVRVNQGTAAIEQWVPAGWQITFPTSPNPIRLGYGWRAVPLPIGLELLNFEVSRNEGSDAPAGFKSTLRISTTDGQSAIGQCWMNHPFSFPAQWWRTWTGLTFKISQASWNPENLEQSTVQILRDPGWALKWIGSLLVVTGVFMMFYVKKFRRQYGGERLTTRRDSKRKKELVTT